MTPEKLEQIKKAGGYYDKNHRWNSIVTFSGDTNIYRGRVETIIVRDKKEIFVKRKPGGEYYLPGGSTDKYNSDIAQARNECLEEARINIKNIYDSGLAYKEFPKMKRDYLSENDVKWDGSYTQIYIAEYESFYKGNIPRVDQDRFILSGRFYSVKECLHFFRKEHKDALFWYLQNSICDMDVSKTQLNNLYHGERLFYLSKEELNKKFVTPSKSENDKINKISLFSSLDGAVMNLHLEEDSEEMVLSIYEPYNYYKMNYLLTTNELVSNHYNDNADIYDEIWVCNDIKMKKIGWITIYPCKNGYIKKRDYNDYIIRLPKYQVKYNSNNTDLSSYALSILNKNHVQKGKQFLTDYHMIPLKTSTVRIIEKIYPDINNIDLYHTELSFFMDRNNIVGIVGVSDNLYIGKWISILEIPDSRYRSYGLSYQLIHYAINKMGANYVKLNSKNKLAVYIYNKIGFTDFFRTDLQTFMFYKKDHDLFDVTEMILKSNKNPVWKDPITIRKENKSQLYYISKNKLSDESIVTIDPSIPLNYFTQHEYEDNKTSRVPLYKDIDSCIMSLSKREKGKCYCIYEPTNENISYYNPDFNEVPDCNITHEVWVKEPIQLQFTGYIQLIESTNTKHMFTYGNKTAEVFEWKWKWIDDNVIRKIM